MNILLAHYKIQDYGGIVNYSEFLARGLRELGHNVSAVMLRNKGKTGTPKHIDRELDAGWEYGSGLRLWMHQKQGWQGMFQVNYVEDFVYWKNLTHSMDLIIYVVPVPTCSKEYKADSYWPDLYTVPECPQLAVVHDGNMQKLYPHINTILPELKGVICVHDAAYNSCDVLPVPRMLIPNPHEIPEDFDPMEPEERDQGFLSLQTFKRWKHVDDLIKAIPYMRHSVTKLIAGGGIEYHYMTSKTKVKKEYLDSDGQPIWDNALQWGMEYLGYITTEERDMLLKRTALLVDPSWSKSYSKLGAHFNRVMVEAMAYGCVPVCTDLGMLNSSFFKKDENYIEVPHDATPLQYANIIQGALADPQWLWEMQQNNLALVKQFACGKIAADILEFANSRNSVNGSSTLEFERAADKRMEFFYDL